MLESCSKNERDDMSATAQMMMRDYAGTRWPTLNHKGRIARLANTLGIGHRRVRSLYQNEPGVRLRADEMAAIEALRKVEADDAVRTSQQEYRALEARIASLEALFAAGDEEHGRPHLDALRSTASEQGFGPRGGVAGNGQQDHGEG